MSMSSTTRNVIVSLAIAAVFIWLAVDNVEGEELAEALGKFDPWYLTPAVLINSSFRPWKKRKPSASK